VLGDSRVLRDKLAATSMPMSSSARARHRQAAWGQPSRRLRVATVP
jgi:hypothetical protein